MAGIPPFNPQQPIPNNPFYYPDALRYNFNSPPGTLIFGDNFIVDYTTGLVQFAPIGNRGTLRLLSANRGLTTVPAGGITVSGSVELATIPLLTPGTYNDILFSYDAYGRVVSIVSQTPGITSLAGTAPIYITGTNPSVTVNISPATLRAPGAVQLVDDLVSADPTRALSAKQGYVLGQEMLYLGNQIAGQTLAGIVNVATGNVTAVTPDGASNGVVVGSPVPAATPALENFYFYTTGSGNYTPPGGATVSCVPNDRVICIGGVWQVVQSGVRLLQATTTVAGISKLAVGTDVRLQVDNTLFVTPGSLSVMTATTTQTGFVKLASSLQTLALTDTTNVLTPSDLGLLKATTSTRGLVLLSDSVQDPSLENAPTSNALKTYVDSSQGLNIIQAKGDLIVGQSLATPIRLPQGTNGSLLVVDISKPAQGSLDWNVPDSLASWPVGGIIWYTATDTPPLWVPCDGEMYDGTLGSPYYNLYQVIGTTYNTGGEPADYFRVPDLRGAFVRGWSGSGTNPTPSALDPGRLFATYQQSAYTQHIHGITDPGHIHSNPLPTHNHTVTDPTHSHAIPNTASHSHAMDTRNVSQVGSGNTSYYDGGGIPTGPAETDKAFTGITLALKTTGITIANAFTGINKTLTCVTGMTVTEPSPPTAPSPNETRPVNTALMPMIKYGNVVAGPTPAPPPPTYTLAVTPSSATNNITVTGIIRTTDIADNTKLYWKMSGTGVTSAFFTSGTLTGFVNIINNTATFSQKFASSLPAGGPYTVNVQIFTDATFTNQVGITNAVQVVTPNITPTKPKLGVYVDLWQYRNTDATYPYAANSGLNPVVRASNIATNVQSATSQINADKFYLLAEVQVYGVDGKLYAGNPAGFPTAAQVLNGAGNGWNTNTGSAQGTYVSPTNPDYTYSAWAQKNTIAYMTSQSVNQNNFIVSIGGYNLSNTMDQVGSNPALVSTAVSQIVTFMGLCGAKGVDIDYEPVGAPCQPANMATFMSALYTAVKAVNPAYEVHLTLVPSLDLADSNLRIATAVACQNFTDQINIMTYDDPSNLDQPNYQPGDIPVYDHTGVARSAQSVQWFIDAGVTRSKLAMGIASYGRDAALGNAFATGTVPYSQVVAAADAAGQVTNTFPLGRYYGGVNIENPAPTTQSNYYSNPQIALWAFDSVSTITSKVQSASNMGLRAVFMWQVSQDYADPTSPLPIGNARANFALLGAARKAISNIP